MAGNRSIKDDVSNTEKPHLPSQRQRRNQVAGANRIDQSRAIKARYLDIGCLARLGAVVSLPKGLAEGGLRLPVAVVPLPVL